MENFIELTSNDTPKGLILRINPLSIDYFWRNFHTQIYLNGGQIIKVTESPAEIDAKISEWKKRNCSNFSSSSTDSLIVENLRAHLESAKKELSEIELSLSESGSLDIKVELQKERRVVINKISLLEEIHSLQKTFIV